jgi:biotin operon repressor
MPQFPTVDLYVSFGNDPEEFCLSIDALHEDEIEVVISLLGLHWNQEMPDGCRFRIAPVGQYSIIERRKRDSEIDELLIREALLGKSAHEIERRTRGRDSRSKLSEKTMRMVRVRDSVRSLIAEITEIGRHHTGSVVQASTGEELMKHLLEINLCGQSALSPVIHYRSVGENEANAPANAHGESKSDPPSGRGGIPTGADLEGVHPETKLLTGRQQEVWDALNGRLLSDTELASPEWLDTGSDEGIRQFIKGIRDKGYKIQTQRGRGYFRPDAPPSE